MSEATVTTLGRMSAEERALRVDVAAAFRFSNRVQVYLNDGGTTFGSTIEIATIASVS